MSRMIVASFITVLLTQVVLADDCVTPIRSYGQRPFNNPKAPCPNGVMAPGVCFGYHGTRWTPWQLACQDCGTVVVQSGPGTPVSNKGIILFEQSAKVPAAGQLVPSPEQAKPMPPVRP